jgi:hypothetical protein
MFWLLFIVSTIVIGIAEYINDNEDNWPKRGIELIAYQLRLPLLGPATLTLAVPPQEVDKRIYDKFKAREPAIKIGGTKISDAPSLYFRP